MGRAAVRRLGLALACGVGTCLAAPQLPARSPSEPGLFLWAWERPTTLDRLDTRRAGVAYLAGSLLLRGDALSTRPRLQPLAVPPATRLVAVVRLDITRDDPPRYTPDQQSEAAVAVLRFARSAQASSGALDGVQIDFDAPVSGRSFYTGLLRELRRRLPPSTGLSMTALASWCLGDPWIQGLPVDESVPMLFRMGTGARRVRAFLERNEGFAVPVCRDSVGISTDEPTAVPPGSRRIYLFNPRGWTNESAARALEAFSR